MFSWFVVGFISVILVEIILIIIILLEIILIVIIIILYNELALDHVQLVALAMIRGEF